MENSKIQWTTHTWNPWRGCQKVSPGCEQCYAETLSNRNPTVLGKWGSPRVGGTRIVASEAQWKLPVKWNREAQIRNNAWQHGIGLCNGDEQRCLANGFIKPERPRVFCASLADVFEDWTGPMMDAHGDYLYCEPDGSDWEAMIHDPDEAESQLDPRYSRPLTMNDVRSRLFSLIEDTPNLDWLLLSKRPENFVRFLPQPLGIPAAPDNVWLGVSVEDQRRADERIPMLLATPAKVRFLSCEPLLGPVLFDNGWSVRGHPWVEDGETASTSRGIDWVIVGGESGSGARAMNLEWARRIIQQCKDAGVACFVKQLGSNPVWTHWDGKPTVGVDQPYCASSHTNRDGTQTLTRLEDKKGGDIAEFPKDLQVREFPTVDR